MLQMKVRSAYRIFTRIRKYAWQDQLLVISVAFLLLVLRASLKFWRFDVLYSFINSFKRKPIYSYKQHADYTQKAVQIVEKSGKYLLKTKCLAQALAVHVLLNKKRIANTIHLGFVKNRKSFTAHAWVRAEDKILTGFDHRLSLYFRLPYDDKAGIDKSVDTL